MQSLSPPSIMSAHAADTRAWQRAYLLLSAYFVIHASAQHSILNFNHNWKYYVGDLPWICATEELFPINLTGSHVSGLATIPGIESEADCRSQCGCDCQVYQFCDAAHVVGATSLCLPSAEEPTAPASLACTNSSASFPLDLNNWQCSGLSEVSAHSEAECASACCNSSSCQVYQWCSESNPNCSPAPSCWIGALTGGCTITSIASGWISRGKTDSAPSPICQTGLLAEYGPGNIETFAGSWKIGARLAPPTPPTQPSGPATPGYDDSQWLPATLPFDYLAFVAPSNTNPAPHQMEHGAVPFHNAWFRKNFTVPDGVQLARLQFDGVYRSAAVFLNGVLAGQHEEGYTGFSVWLHNVTGSPLLRESQGVNCLAIRIDDTTYTYELWSYEGAGFREVALHLHSVPVSVSPFGVFVQSELVSAPLQASRHYLSADALIIPQVDVSNDSNETVLVNISASVIVPAMHVTILGESLVTATVASWAMVQIPAQGWKRTSLPPLHLRPALLWGPASSPDDPVRPLYTLVTSLATAQQQVLDAVNTTFGIRSAVFSASQGLLINGVPTKIRGLSVHQDFLAVGTALPPALHRYRLHQLLSMGANGYRTAHNPVSTSFLDAADAAGVLVWSENRFLRMFEQYVQDATDMVQRDRNHPSIILWSLCNENGCGESPNFEGSPPGLLAGAALAATYMAAMKKVDGTRPITANAHNTAGLNGSIYESLDVLGLTYDYGSLPKIHAAFPDKPLLNGESCSCQSDRGSAPSAGNAAIDCSAAAWSAALALPYVAGQFVWSGWDYRGESSWPYVYSHYGILDVAGFPKPVWNWYRAWWGAEAHLAPFVAAFPPWDASALTSTASASIDITALTASPFVQLYVNGVAASPRQAVANLSRTTWTKVPYQPGNYTVLAFSDATSPAIAAFTSVTPGNASALVLVLQWPQTPCLQRDGVDAAVVAVAVVDELGVIVPSEAHVVTLSVVGGGRLLGMNSGDTASHAASAGISALPVYVGTLAAVIQSVAGSTKDVVVSASAPGLKDGALTIPLC